LADTIGVNFETYTLGNVHGQDGWSKTGPFDVAVVTNTYGYGTFGTQSLRISAWFNSRDKRRAVPLQFE